jgi:hypothetical protein
LAVYDPSLTYPTNYGIHTVNGVQEQSDWLTWGYYNEAYTANVVDSASVTYNGYHSIADILPCVSANNIGAINGPIIWVSPGETITYSVWIKTTATGDTNHQDGMQIGMDFFDKNLNDVSGTSYQNGAPGGSNTIIPWGTTAWTQMTISFVMPATVAYQDQGMANSGGYSVGQAVAAVAVQPWADIGGSGSGTAYFADPVFYN